MDQIAAAKQAAEKVVDGRLPQLVTLSHSIHAHPELAFEEERSSALVAEALAAAGFEIEAGVCDIPTAFVASAGQGSLTIAICAEYDALPGIGHACGHNVIAAAAVGAGLALAPLADDLGVTIKIMGTPAEEGGGGKILMLERGAFAGVNAAMMVHPAPVEQVSMSCLAVSHVDVAYTGKQAHASAYAERGVNAADALVVAQVAIGLLRQQLPVGDQVHGIVTSGGEAANVIPGHTSARYMWRSLTLESLAQLEPRVRACFEAGATASGAALEISPVGPTYSEMRADPDLVAAYRRNAEAIGRSFPEQPGQPMGGSTDMANISLAIPTIHPMLDIESLPAVNHQPEFAAACVTAAADRAVRDGALAMAMTAVDAATEPHLRARLAASGV